jgi:hypothetical protein
VVTQCRCMIDAARPLPNRSQFPSASRARLATKSRNEIKRRNKDMTEKLSKLRSAAPGIAKIAFVLALSIGTSSQSQSNSGVAPPAPGVDKIHPASTPAQPPAKCLKRTPAATEIGTHTVFLTWNASPSSNAVGYCLYRRIKPNIPPRIEACNDCEQLNTVPIKATRCVIEKVPDTPTYHYVATAINGDSNMSEVSNEATPVPKAIPAGSFDSCRLN